MAELEAFALHEGAFGRAVVLNLEADLVPHSHSEAHIAFWLGGARAQARIGSEVLQYSDQVALGVNAFEQHDMTLLDSDAPSVFLCFYMSRPWLEERRLATGRPLAFTSARVPINAMIRRACWTVLDLMLNAHEPRARVDDEVEQLLGAAIEASVAYPDHGMRVNAHPSLDHRLRRAIAYMREHVGDKTPVDDIAAKVGLSRAHFFALFRDQLHTTPQVFWSAVRVEEAIRRLLYEGESLTAVAMDLGFSAPSNFSRFFKGHTGVRPSTYRRAALAPSPVGSVTGLPNDREAVGLAPPRPSQQQGPWAAPWTRP